MTTLVLQVSIDLEGIKSSNVLKLLEVASARLAQTKLGKYRLLWGGITLQRLFYAI